MRSQGVKNPFVEFVTNRQWFHCVGVKKKCHGQWNCWIWQFEFFFLVFLSELPIKFVPGFGRFVKTLEEMVGRNYCHQKRERGWKTNTTSQGTCVNPNIIVASWRFVAKDAAQTTHKTLTHTCSDLSTETTYSYTNRHSGSQNPELAPYKRLSNRKLLLAWTAMHIITDPTAIQV